MCIRSDQIRDIVCENDWKGLRLRNDEKSLKDRGRYWKITFLRNHICSNCYNFIKDNSCNLNIECPYGHVIIPDDEKEEYLKLNPPNYETNFKEIMQQSTYTKVGKNIITKCKNCGKGIVLKNEDIESNSIKMNLCKICLSSGNF